MRPLTTQIENGDEAVLADLRGTIFSALEGLLTVKQARPVVELFARLATRFEPSGGGSIGRAPRHDYASESHLLLAASYLLDAPGGRIF